MALAQQCGKLSPMTDSRDKLLDPSARPRQSSAYPFHSERLKLGILPPVPAQSAQRSAAFASKGQRSGRLSPCPPLTSSYAPHSAWAQAVQDVCPAHNGQQPTNPDWGVAYVLANKKQRSKAHGGTCIKADTFHTQWKGFGYHLDKINKETSHLCHCACHTVSL